jgi:hypothetical protein
VITPCGGDFRCLESGDHLALLADGCAGAVKRRIRLLTKKAVTGGIAARLLHDAVISA